MKKILLFIILNMVAAATFAAVEQSASEIEINSEVLNSKYSGYQVVFKNMGKNPVKVVNIEISNAVTNAESMLTSLTLSANKKDRKLLYLSPFTLGITGIIYVNKVQDNIDKQKDGMSEAAKFNAPLSTILNTGHVLVNGMTSTVKVLVPKGETPNVSAVFQDTKTNEYIGVTK